MSSLKPYSQSIKPVSQFYLLVSLNIQHNVNLSYSCTTNDQKPIDTALDSVSHQMSGKGCDNDVTSATTLLLAMGENAFHPMYKTIHRGKEDKRGSALSARRRCF